MLSAAKRGMPPPRGEARLFQHFRLVTMHLATQPNWQQLSHAYGAASDLPELLAALSPDPAAPVWGALCDRVCDPGASHSAGPYVLPYLVDAMAGWEASRRVVPLSLASAIVASPQFPMDGHIETVVQLGALATETLQAKEISQTERAHTLSALLTFSGELLWGSIVERLPDDGFLAICPSCAGNLYFAFGSSHYFTLNDFYSDCEHARQPIDPRDPSELAGIARWLVEVASYAHDLDLAERICHLFGSSVCPCCELPVSVAEAIEKFETR